MSAGWKRCCDGSTPQPFQCGSFSGLAKARAPLFGHAPVGEAAAVSCAFASSEPAKTISENPTIAPVNWLQENVMASLIMDGSAGFQVLRNAVLRRADDVEPRRGGGSRNMLLDFASFDSACGGQSPSHA